MDVNKKKVVKAVLIVVLILIILLLGVLYWRGKTYSKYGKEINSESMAEVAKPIFVPFAPIDCTSIICINIVQLAKAIINAIPDIRIFIPFVFIFVCILSFKIL